MSGRVPSLPKKVTFVLEDKGDFLMLFTLNLKYSECVENRRYKNENDAYWCNVFYNHLKKSFLLELGIKLNLFNNCFRFNYITYEDAGEESNYRHKHTVADEIEEVKELKTDDRYVPEHPITERGKKPEHNGENKHDKARNLA